MCALDDHGHPRFEWLINRDGSEESSCITCSTSYDSAIRTSEPSHSLYRRKKLLKKNDTLRYVDHVENDGLHLFAGALALDSKVSSPKTNTAPLSPAP